MQEEYTGTLLEDDHISIPQEIIYKLNINICLAALQEESHSH